MKCITIGCTNEGVEDPAHLSVTGIAPLGRGGHATGGYQCDACQAEIESVGVNAWVATHRWESGTLVWDGTSWVEYVPPPVAEPEPEEPTPPLTTPGIPG